MPPGGIRDAASFRIAGLRPIRPGSASKEGIHCQLPIANCQLGLPLRTLVWKDSRATPHEMKTRTKKFALRILNLADKLPPGLKGRILADQLGRAGTSVAANYRAACKGRSKAEFIAKLGVAEEEADEVQFWLEMIGDAALVQPERLLELQQEARELTAIIAASRKSASRDK
jgi:four helix bundle protein